MNFNVFKKHTFIGKLLFFFSFFAVIDLFTAGIKTLSSAVLRAAAKLVLFQLLSWFLERKHAFFVFHRLFCLSYNLVSFSRAYFRPSCSRCRA